MDPAEKIARRYRSGLIGYDWALFLVARERCLTDSWTPIVVLSNALRELARG